MSALIRSARHAVAGAGTAPHRAQGERHDLLLARKPRSRLWPRRAFALAACRIVVYASCTLAHTLALRLSTPVPNPRARFIFFLCVAGKEERLHDYSARKANVAASELSMWDDELSLHAPDAAVAEESVLRQRTLEWRLRERPSEWQTVVQAYKFPFLPSQLKVQPELK